METKHSKGEWFACCLDAKPHFVFAGEGEKTVCSMFVNDPEYDSDHGWQKGEILTIEECRANARLIQAAPKMLGALIEISEGKGRYDLDPKQHLINCIEDMIEIANKAIKEATE